MKTELRIVTPAIARDWLTHNTDNRPLRPGVVEGFLLAYKRGEWKATHQGIAFAKSGRLLDGQHRLTMISQLDEGSEVAINVTSGMDEGTFVAIDQGFRRTASDVLGISAGLASVGRFFARLANSGQAAGLSVQYVAPFAEWVTDEYEVLVSFCSAPAQIWSSAPMRAGAIFQMKRGHDPDFIMSAYRSLVMSDIDAMPYAARMLMQQRMSGKIVSARTTDLFCRALRVFDSNRTGKINRISIKDAAGTLEEARQFVLKEMRKSPASAGRTVAKPGRNSTALRRAA